MAGPKKKKRKKLTPEQKARNAFNRLIRSTVESIGFAERKGLRDRTVSYQGEKSDFDGVFVRENVVLIAEYTTRSKDISEHIKKKKTLYDKIVADSKSFVEHLSTLDDFFNQSKLGHAPAQCVVRVLYFSKNDVPNSTKSQVPSVKCIDFGHVKYFESLGKTIRHAASYEFLEFLEIKQSDYAPTSSPGSKVYSGSLLPEAHSNFDDGYKIVSFYVDPAALLSRAYVLRKDGWKDADGVYQRMIEKKKVDSIRVYLRDKKRVFINNIIVTLSPSTKIIDDHGDTVDFSKIHKTTPVRIQVPDSFNSIGIIDGQHRVFSYHEGGIADTSIAPLRNQQNLLVTGVVYPADIDEADRIKFEAQLFLEINSNQTNARTDLKQAIQQLTAPFSPEAIGRAIIEKLNNDSQPLSDKFERYFYDSGKLKTSSIVSFGLKPLVKTSGSDSLFSIWPHSNKIDFIDSPTSDLKKDYVKFCFDEINKIFVALQKHMPSEKWTADRSVEGRLLTTVVLNGMLITLRKVIAHNKPRTQSDYDKWFAQIDKFEFNQYHSSQYNRLAEDIFESYIK